jgi:hypothetical protein
MLPLTRSQLQRDVARLADGSLDAEQTAAAQARVAAAGPKWTQALERQRAALARIHEAAPELPDSAALLNAARAAAAQEARPGSPRRAGRARIGRRPLALAAGSLGAIGAALLAVVLLVGGGGAGGPSVAEAATLGLRPAQTGPPPHSTSPALLAVSQSGIAFPDWTHKFGWRPDGVREDRLGGRDVTTVFYGWHGHRIAYSIVSGGRLAIPIGADREHYTGTHVWVSVLSGRTVVMWYRLGHTCVLSGVSIAPDALAHLAAWHVPGEVTS